MFESTRRDAIRQIALGLTAAGSLEIEAAQHVHEETAAEKKAAGAYTVKAFTKHEYATVRRLAELIVPADEVSGSAVEAGAPEFIDLLASQNRTLADIYHGGLAWLDNEMRRRHGKAFVECAAGDQTAMLDALVAAEREERVRAGEQLVYERAEHYRGFAGYTTNRASDLGPGVKFLDWIRKMTVDAFYTSPAGMKDVAYPGGKGMSRYVVPKESIDYAMSRSPFQG